MIQEFLSSSETHFTEVQISRGDILSRAGEVEKYFYYLQSGALRAYSFLEYQEKWLDILDQAKTFDLNRHKCSLTIRMIKMNLGATLQFVIAHQERHINQAERALSTAGA